ncbi:MAG: hypothetical protein U0228_38720 [Myxococcaceae bacterium]
MGFLKNVFGGGGSGSGSDDGQYTKWALEQIKTRSAGADMVAPSLQALIDALGALRGRSGVQVFGVAVERIESAGRAKVDAAIVEALSGWKRHFEANGDAQALLALSTAGKALGLSDLASVQRAPLRCDPLGGREGLSKEWQQRLDRLQEARSGSRTLNLAAMECVMDESPHVEFGTPDADALYAFALGYETEHETAFPAELAAFFSIANGVSVGDDPFLRPVADWEWDFDDRGLCIGCGGYVQGSLILETDSGRNLMSVPVIDVDDDGEERARHANSPRWSTRCSARSHSRRGFAGSTLFTARPASQSSRKTSFSASATT